MNAPVQFRNDVKISWYRSKVDKAVMSRLMQKSDFQGFRQVLCQLGLFALTGALAYMAFLNVHVGNWHWSLPLLCLALFIHGTGGPFMSLIAVHELVHKTPFKTLFWNEFFLKLYSFISWSDHVWFRPSHVKHHQFTVHKCCDGEVVLPQKLTLRDWRFWLGLFAWNPLNTWNTVKTFYKWAHDRIEGDWNQHILPAAREDLRREHRHWARLVLMGHAILAALFILSGHWFLIVVFTIGTQYCSWLGFLCGQPQHYGLSPDKPDFRLSCRTYTCSWLPAFYYWNMQYHIEHHMFPAVPFYNLPKLRKTIEHDLPPAPHGLWATWKEILAIHREMKADPNYCHLPPLPRSSIRGDYSDAETLESEALLAT